MPGEPRALPDRPSLRYLKLEAKRRLAAGEFHTLHDAQVAIAWEHGVPSWTALKQLISDGPALVRLRWFIARFRDGDASGWTAPDEQELRQHFADQVLDTVPPDQLIAQLVPLAAALRGDPVVIGQTPVVSRIRLADIDVLGRVEADPPHKLLGLFVCAMTGVGLGAIVRHTAGAVSALVGLVYVPAVLGLLPAPWNYRIDRFTLIYAAQQVVALHPRPDLFSPTVSMLVLLAWPAAVLLTAAVLVRRRDV